MSIIDSIIDSAIPNKIDALLDFGCKEGAFLNSLSEKKIRNLFGIDVVAEYVNKANSQKSSPNINFALIKPGQPLPFKDDFLNVITMFQVLEHVGNEAFVINEVKRVLKRGGIFICNTPHNGLFGWADSTNFQFKFPGIYKLVYTRINGEDWYREQTIEKNGMIGSITVSSNTHHKHFNQKDFQDLLGGDFQIIKTYYYNCFYPLITILSNIIFRLLKLLKLNNGYIAKLIRLLEDRLLIFDKRITSKTFGYHILIIAKKI